MLARILTPWRVTWYARGALLALVAVFVLTVWSATGTKTIIGGRLGGDYPAFYAAGRIVAAGEAENLYSLATQRDYQRPLIGAASGVLPFAYPPPLAIVYAPLSQLPFAASYAVHTLLMAAALALACALIGRLYPRLIARPELLFFLALTGYPILRSVMGAQNTALSLLLIVLVWYKVLHNRHYQAGVFLGLLFFKPQFALPLSGLLFLSGRWRVWLSAAATAALMFAASTVLIGSGWIAGWLDLVGTFSRLDVQVNFAELVSWQGFSRALLGHDNSFAAGLGWGLAAATVLGLCWAWFAGGRNADFNSQMALASAGIVTISPHTLYYDSGIALVAVVVLLSRREKPGPGLILGIWAAALLQLLSPLAGVSLTFVPLVAVLALAFVFLWPADAKSKGAHAA